MRRSCADIALGFDDATGAAVENFAGPPNITPHGLNGIVIAGGEDRQECHYFTSGNYWT